MRHQGNLLIKLAGKGLNFMQPVNMSDLIYLVLPRSYVIRGWNKESEAPNMLNSSVFIDAEILLPNITEKNMTGAMFKMRKVNPTHFRINPPTLLVTTICPWYRASAQGCLREGTCMPWQKRVDDAARHQEGF